MSNSNEELNELAIEAHDRLIILGNIAVSFAQVERLTVYSKGNFENDSEHSFHLALSATELAASYYPELDTGLVSQFCLVHDLPEIYAGDVPSYDLSDEERRSKEKAEAIATERLLSELPPHIADLLSRYEKQEEPEARFVRLVDKLMPAVIHAIASKDNREIFLQKYGIKTIEELEERSVRRTNELIEMFPEFDLIHMIRILTSSTARRNLFDD